jgi:hypothetical protein
MSHLADFSLEICTLWKEERDFELIPMPFYNADFADGDFTAEFFITVTIN